MRRSPRGARTPGFSLEKFLMLAFSLCRLPLVRYDGEELQSTEMDMGSLGTPENANKAKLKMGNFPGF